MQGFLAEGLQRTSAGLGSVIIDSQPLSVALLASVLFGETLSVAGYIGLAVGVFGLCLLEVSPDTLPTLLHWGSNGKRPSEFTSEGHHRLKYVEPSGQMVCNDFSEA
jgi:hypothetical protein